MLQILAMTEAVQLAIVNAVAPTVVAITGLVIVMRKLNKVEKQTNGRLSEAEAKAERAEQCYPGSTKKHPPGTEIKTIMSINDPTTPDPPKVIENFTVVPPKTPPTQEKP